MRIVYPYNEILPKKTAHDVYVFHNCLSLSKVGFQVELFCGKGSLENKNLCQHYNISRLEELKIRRLPILRKNIFSFSWNRVFFFFTQRKMERLRPEIAIFSVLKQGEYHFQRKIFNIRYVYEVHQLAWYPYMSLNQNSEAVKYECSVLKRADLITVTTDGMRQILLSPPYLLKNPIKVVPLAVDAKPLPLKSHSREPLFIMYVGQLYKEQGLEILIRALAKTEGIFLEILGGREEEIKFLQRLALRLEVSKRIHFRGFCLPSEIPCFVEKADAFVAPFDFSGRMPYVAHTKLIEYASWGRPTIVPDMPVVREHFKCARGVLFFEPGNDSDLARCLNEMKSSRLRRHLQSRMLEDQKNSWDMRSICYGEILKDLVSSKNNIIA